MPTIKRNYTFKHNFRRNNTNHKSNMLEKLNPNTIGIISDFSTIKNTNSMLKITRDNETRKKLTRSYYRPAKELRDIIIKNKSVHFFRFC